MKLYCAYDKRKNEILEFEGEPLFTNRPTLFERIVEWHNKVILRPKVSLKGMDIVEYVPCMTHEAFAEEMARLSALANEDREMAHVMMDNAMCEILKALGYTDGVEIFKNTHKWYV